MNTAARIACPAQLNRETGKALFQTVRTEKLGDGRKLVLDFTATTAMDSVGGAWLVEIANHARKRNTDLQCENHSGQVREFIDMIEPALVSAAPVPAKPMGLLESLGNTTLGTTTELRQFLELCVNAIYWTLIAPLEGRGLRWGLLLDEIHEMGVRAVRIVCLMKLSSGTHHSDAHGEAGGKLRHIALCGRHPGHWFQPGTGGHHDRGGGFGPYGRGHCRRNLHDEGAGGD